MIDVFPFFSAAFIKGKLAGIYTAKIQKKKKGKKKKHWNSVLKWSEYIW